MKLSARNRAPATVTKLTKGEAIANVELDCGGQRIVASITVEAVTELGLSEGSEVTAIITTAATSLPSKAAVRRLVVVTTAGLRPSSDRASSATLPEMRHTIV